MEDPLGLHHRNIEVSIAFSPFFLKKGDRMETNTLLSGRFWLEKIFLAELEACINLMFFPCYWKCECVF